MAKSRKIDFKIRAFLAPTKEFFSSHLKGKFFSDISVQLFLIVGAFVLLLIWAFSFYYFRVGDFLVPTKYNSFWGTISLGNWFNLYEMPLFFTLVFIVNILLGKAIFEKDKFLGYILVLSNIFIGIIVLVNVINFGRFLNL